uniref:C-type lectin domain-containing protein n=2 Tax=Oreochromis aureus TaxID=47969 RepID=A0AAZ1XFF6_OREAU
MDGVHENTEEVLGCRRKSKREHKTAEDIYMNHEVIQTVQRKTTGPAPPGPEFVKKSSCRAAVILLSLLCLFLLIGLITVVFLFTQGKSQWEMETEIIHELYDNVTSERNQLQTSYNILTTKQDQLQTSYNNLVKERDQLQKRLEDLTTNRDDLQRKLQYCRENWVVFSNSLYQVSSEKKSWQESRQDCLQKGAHLMIINSQEEQNFVNQFKKNLWIGLTDSQTEGTWKWVDGTRTSTSYWNRRNGEPNGGTQQNCGEIDNYNAEDSWNDAPCSNRQFWICEKRVSP